MIPFPIILGKIFDNACLVWKYECGERGSCWIYDSSHLAIALTLFIVLAKVFIVLCYCVALKLYEPPPPVTEDPTNTGKETKNEPSKAETNHFTNKAFEDDRDFAKTASESKYHKEGSANGEQDPHLQNSLHKL